MPKTMLRSMHVYCIMCMCGACFQCYIANNKILDQTTKLMVSCWSIPVAHTVVIYLIFYWTLAMVANRRSQYKLLTYIRGHIFWNKIKKKLLGSYLFTGPYKKKMVLPLCLNFTATCIIYENTTVLIFWYIYLDRLKFICFGNKIIYFFYHKQIAIKSYTLFNESELWWEYSRK